MNCKELAAALGYPPDLHQRNAKSGFPDVAKPDDGDGGTIVSKRAFRVSEKSNMPIVFMVS
jgi:hypothetical protein